MKTEQLTAQTDKQWKLKALYKNIIRYKYAYLMIMPVLAYYIVFCYLPMYGSLIAFQDYSLTGSILGGKWVGFKHFINFFNSLQFKRVITNTILISLYSLLFQFPAPIIFALLLNELGNVKYKRTIQTITYFPHFISVVIICGLLKDFTLSDGIINDLIVLLGGERSNLLAKPLLFKPILIMSDIWQNTGWGSIIYLASLAGIDVQLYEACEIDGGGKFKKMRHITLPGILPTIIILLIMRIGQLLSVGYEKIILLYNPLTYSTADVISSYIYRRGLIEHSWNSSTAIGLFNSIINLGLLCGANHLSRKFNETSLW